MEDKQALVPSIANENAVETKSKHGKKNQKGLSSSSQCSCIKKLKISNAKAEKITPLKSCEKFSPIIPMPGPGDASVNNDDSMKGATQVPPTCMQHTDLENSIYGGGIFLNDKKELVNSPRQKLPIRRNEEMKKKKPEAVQVSDAIRRNEEMKMKGPEVVQVSDAIQRNEEMKMKEPEVVKVSDAIRRNEKMKMKMKETEVVQVSDVIQRKEEMNMKEPELVQVSDDSMDEGDAEPKKVPDLDVELSRVKRDFDLNTLPPDWEEE